MALKKAFQGVRNRQISRNGVSTLRGNVMDCITVFSYGRTECAGRPADKLQVDILLSSVE